MVVKGFILTEFGHNLPFWACHSSNAAINNYDFPFPGQMAKHLARQEESRGPSVVRQGRNPHADTYIPTFFTSQQNHAALSAARPHQFGSSISRSGAESFESPLYRRARA